MTAERGRSVHAAVCSSAMDALLRSPKGNGRFRGAANGLTMVPFPPMCREAGGTSSSANCRRDQIPVVATLALDIVGPHRCTKHGTDVLGRVAGAVTGRRLVCTGVELLHLGD